MFRRFVCLALTLYGGIFAKADNFFFIGPAWDYSQASLKDVGIFNGSRWGVVGGYEYFNEWDVFGVAEYTYQQGDLRDGQNNYELKQRLNIFSGRVGYTLAKNPFSFTPYTGFAYRYIHEKRDFSAATSNTFDYYLPYVPVGIKLHANINPQWFIGLDYQYQINFDSYLAIATLQGTRWELKPKDDQYFDLMFSYRPTQLFGIRLIPYFHYFRLGPTTAQTSTGTELGIPKQTYKTFGATLEATLHF